MVENERFVGKYQVHGDIREFHTTTSGEAFNNVDNGLFMAHQSFPYAKLEGIVFRVIAEKPRTLQEIITVEYPAEVRP